MLLVTFAVLRFVFFNDTATTEISTLSLHDALPICAGRCLRALQHEPKVVAPDAAEAVDSHAHAPVRRPPDRSASVSLPACWPGTGSWLGGRGRAGGTFGPAARRGLQCPCGLARSWAWVAMTAAWMRRSTPSLASSR